MRPFALIAACAATGLCSGCGDTDNDRIQVKNQTSDPILVSDEQAIAYPGYSDTDGDGDIDPRSVVEQRREWVPAHADQDIWVRDILWFTQVAAPLPGLDENLRPRCRRGRCRNAVGQARGFRR